MAQLLVIEDDADLRRTLVSALHDVGHRVDEAIDGAQGLEMLLAGHYDGVVLDVMLPRKNGFDVLNRFREEYDTPVLMLTAKDSLRDRVSGLDAGADDYLTKPFELEELLARVRSILRRQAVSETPQLRAGEVLLKTATREVLLAGQPVELTAREYAFAEILLRHRGQVVSRPYLYEQLFDESEDNVANTLDVYVYKLRQKLGKDFVKTRRGHGYLTE